MLRGLNYKKSLVFLTLVLLVSSLLVGVFVPKAEGQTAITVGTQISTVGIVGTVIVMAGLISLILVIIAKTSAYATAKINRNPIYIKEHPHDDIFFRLRAMFTLGYYAIYVEGTAVAKINVMLKRKLDDVEKLSFRTTAFAALYTICISPIIYALFVLLLNVMARLGFAATAGEWLLNGLNTIIIGSIGNSVIYGIICLIGWIIIVLVAVIWNISEINNVKDRLIKIANSYSYNERSEELNELLEWYENDNNGIFGADKRAKMNRAVFEELRRMHNPYDR